MTDLPTELIKELIDHLDPLTRAMVLLVGEPFSQVIMKEHRFFETRLKVITDKEYITPSDRRVIAKMEKTKAGWLLGGSLLTAALESGSKKLITFLIEDCYPLSAEMIYFDRMFAGCSPFGVGKGYLKKLARRSERFDQGCRPATFPDVELETLIWLYEYRTGKVLPISDSDNYDDCLPSIEPITKEQLDREIDSYMGR